MANKNLFTKFASLAMAGALAFSAVPVGGLTGAFAASNDGMTLTTLGKNLVWNPDNTEAASPITPSNIVEVSSGTATVTPSDLTYTITKGKNTITPVTKVPTTTVGDYSISAVHTDGTEFGPVEYEVTKLNLSQADDVTLTADEVVYNGDYQEAVVDTDDGISFTKNNNAGYDGETIATKITTSVGNWYEVPAGGEDVGEYTGKVKSYGGSSDPLDGEKEYTFEITAFPINANVIAAGDATIEVGQKAKNSSVNPTVVVKADLKDDGNLTTLEEGTDYSVSFEDTSSTKGKAFVTFNGNYTGEAVADYNIVDEEYDLANATLTMKNGTVTVDENHHITYNGTTKKITPTVKMLVNGAETTLTDGTNGAGDYTVEYEYDKDPADYAGANRDVEADAGIVTVKINAKQNSKYGGQLIGQFVIDPMSIDGTSVTASAQTGLTYDGTTQEATTTLKANGTTLNHGVDGQADDYAVTYEGNVDAGDALAICEGVGNYTGTRSVKFNIAPASLKSNAVEIEDVPNQVYTGSEITPGITATFTNGDNKTVDLVEGEDYALTYKNNIKVGTSATVEAEGTGNFEKTVSKTFKIKEASFDLANATVELSNASIPYDGKNHSAVVKSVKVTKEDGTVKTLTNGSDYEVKNVVAKEVGTYYATIQAPKNSDYAGSQVVSFEITAHDLAGFSLKKSSVKYNGKNQKPELVVAEGTRFDGGNMTEGVDYEVSGIKNIKNVGKLTVKVTGLGGYAGKEQSLTFKVTKADQPMKVSTKTASVKASKVAKKNQTIKASKVFSVSKNQGSVSYKKTSGNSKIKVASNGKITVKKGLKKGTYKIKVKVTAKGNSNYNSGNKTVKATIKVK